MNLDWRDGWPRPSRVTLHYAGQGALILPLAERSSERDQWGDFPALVETVLRDLGSRSGEGQDQ